ncbi:hypothetical protein [Persephonella sp.]
MKSYYWAFRGFLRDNETYPIQSKLAVSEKTVRSWSQPEDSPFHRTNPIDRCVKVLDVFDERSPQLLFDVLDSIAKRYGYSVCSQKQKEFYTIAELNKELNDVVQTYLEISEDGEIDPQEIKVWIKEIREAIFTLNQKLVELEGKVGGQ